MISETRCGIALQRIEKSERPSDSVITFQLRRCPHDSSTRYPHLGDSAGSVAPSVGRDWRLAARLPGVQLPQVRQAELPLLGRRPPGPWAPVDPDSQGEGQDADPSHSSLGGRPDSRSHCGMPTLAAVGRGIGRGQRATVSGSDQARPSRAQAGGSAKKKPVRRPLPKRLPPRSNG